jgi:chemotaxis methyl-accepting protein methylase
MKTIDQVSLVLGRTYGMDVSMFDPAFLRKSIHKRQQDLGYGTAARYCAFLEGDPEEGRALWQALHIHYSAFFRDPLVFALLERAVLPELASVRRWGVRIWCAGCAQGQEAYSIAILLEVAARGSPQPFDDRIFATELDEGVLAAAREGIYPTQALANVSLERAHKWFIPHIDGYQVSPELKPGIDFSVFDLLDNSHASPSASIFGDFDLIFCSNVLIYYKPLVQERLLARLHRCLAPGGYLVTDPAEQAIVQAHGFRAAFPPAPIFQTAPQTRR